MPHSHADYPQLTCPQCGAAFTAEVWLIVDTAERPDLPARVIDGSLHRVVCPNGHAAEVDAPLLLFRPGEEPPLVFSPAQGTTAEQDQEIAAGLVGRLREALGGDWRDEWLEDAANVPRRLLPALLSGDAAALREAMAAAVPPEVAAILAELAADGVTLERPEDLERALEARPALRARLEAALGETSQDDGDAPQEPPDGMTLPPEIARLLQTLQQFIEAPNWLESYRFMLAHPELVSDEAGALLSALLDAATAQGDENAIAVLGDHRDLLRRCREIGAAAAFAEKLGVTTDQLEAALGGDSTGGGVDVPPAFRDDLQRTQVAEQRYQATGDRAALDEATAAWERILNAPGFPAAPERFQLAAFNGAGGVFLRRYRAGGCLPDLDRALALWQTAVARTPADSPDRAAIQNNLGNGLRDRYGRTGRPQDLDAAIAAYEDAVARTPADSPDRAGRLNNLGAGLSDRYGRTGRPQDLDAAIAAYTAALDGINESFQAVAVGYITNAQRQWAGLYARATTALLAAGRPAEALAVAEGSKSRLLTLLMSRGDLPAPPVIPAALVDAERAAAARLSAIDAAALGDHNRAGSEPGEVIRQRSAARAALVAELRAAWQAMAELGPEAAEYVSLRRGDRPTAAGLARLAGELPAGTALLSLFDTGEAGERRRVLLFLLRAGAAGPVVLEAALDPDALYYDYLANYEEEVLDPRRRRALRALGRPLTGRWRGLGRPLLGPLLPHLDGIDHLIIAPVGVYHQLPLHALWIGPADSGAAEPGPAGSTLLDHCAVSYIPALGLLERLVGAPVAPGDLSGRSAVFGYTDADPTTERGAREREIFLGEAAAVAGRLGVEPLLDDAATGAALEAATARPLRRLHLSCHGYFNGQDALASGVLLANGAGGSVVYTARQFMTHRLPVELVTLSACQTAISGSLGGDEMAGLSMGLLSAGARSLLLGQWSVNAQTTEKLMVWFYALLDGAGGPRATKAETLRRVMLAFRDGRILLPGKGFDPADPYYWAPFVLVGNWR